LSVNAAIVWSRGRSGDLIKSNVTTDVALP